MRMTLAAISLAALPVAAHASPVFYGVQSSKTSSVLHGGNRELKTIGFTGSSTLWNGSNFLNWRDGSLTNNAGFHGWNDAIRRDMNTSGNAYAANPDRADNASPFAGEGMGTGTLSEVFGSFNGYKNMSWIIDGEDAGSYTLDLRFAAGQFLSADANADTVELAILERGGNSDLRIFGIFADGSLTGPIVMNRSSTGATGWTLDTLEISGAQSVKGVGISLDASWTNLVGFRFQNISSYNGPDIVAVGTSTLVPTPGSLALMTLGGLIGMRRRR